MVKITLKGETVKTCSNQIQALKFMISDLKLIYVKEVLDKGYNIVR